MHAKILKSWVFFFLALLFSGGVLAKGAASIGVVAVRDLPQEARRTLALIKAGGPFPYARDGNVFHNYEKVLPKRKRGYYHEFTVRTPGSGSRGARRIIAGGVPASSGEYYYTGDHYATFRRIQE